MNKLISLLILSFVAVTLPAQEQEPPFWKDIQSFRKQDSVSFPPRNAILFVGSSSFTMWRKVQEDFPGFTIVNRAFGGSSLPDLIRYVNEIIFPYQPKQVVVYCGDNDIAGSDTISARTVAERFRTLFFLIRSRLPEVSIVFVSIKPSPSRWHLKDKAIQTNELVRKFLAKRKKTGFVNIWDAMIGPDGKPLQELFLEDNLHMNKKGYEIWQRMIEPYLLNNKK